MQVEFDTSYKLFCDIPRYSVFIWNENDRIFVKIGSGLAIDLDRQTTEGFTAEDEVTPCTISKIVLKK